MANGSGLQINQQTVVSVGLAVILIAATWTIATRLATIEATGNANRDAIRRVEQMVDRATSDRWRADDMRHWAQSLGDKNPTIVVPKVDPAASD